jgi:hypothetical protein
MEFIIEVNKLIMEFMIEKQKFDLGIHDRGQKINDHGIHDREK